MDSAGHVSYFYLMTNAEPAYETFLIIKDEAMVNSPTYVLVQRHIFITTITLIPVYFGSKYSISLNVRSIRAHFQCLLSSTAFTCPSVFPTDTHPMWDLTFARQWLYRALSSGMWRRSVCETVTDVSERREAPLFMEENWDETPNLKIEADYSFGTLAMMYQTTLCHISEDSSLQGSFSYGKVVSVLN